MVIKVYNNKDTKKYNFVCLGIKLKHETFCYLSEVRTGYGLKREVFVFNTKKQALNYIKNQDNLHKNMIYLSYGDGENLREAIGRESHITDLRLK